MSFTKKYLAEKPVAEISLIKEKTIFGVSINKNNSVEKIIGRLVVQNMTKNFSRKRSVPEKLLILKK